MEQALRGRVGGIAGLHALLREHGEAIEADLARQGISLAGLVTEAGGLPWRRLRTLIYNLPPGSALHRSMNISIAWDDQSHLLAHVIDQLAAGNWQRGHGKGKKPKPMRRPGQAEAGVTRYGTKQSDPAAARAFLARIGPDRSAADEVDAEVDDVEHDDHGDEGRAESATDK